MDACSCVAIIALTPSTRLCSTLLAARLTGRFPHRFWEHKAAEKKTMSKKEWGELQRKLFTFDTVEEFWKYYAHIPTPSAVFYDGKARKRVGKPPDDRQIESFSFQSSGMMPNGEKSALLVPTHLRTWNAATGPRRRGRKTKFSRPSVTELHSALASLFTKSSPTRFSPGDNACGAPSMQRLVDCSPKLQPARRAAIAGIAQIHIESTMSE